LFTEEFLQLYRDETTKKIESSRIMDDLFEMQDKIVLNRLLCLCGLIYKYSRQFSCGFLELISN
jgi:hypothetical protein